MSLPSFLSGDDTDSGANEISTQFNIRMGIWTNWSRGKIFGSTVTLRRQDADLIIALTAFFIGFAGTRFWRILCFLIHHCRSSPKPQDTLYYQSQAILRNSATAESGLWTFISLFWTWRKRPGKRLIRAILLILTPAFCIAAFIIAGALFSGISTSIGNEVLVSGSTCGAFVNPSYDAFLWMTATFTSHITRALGYAQQCYSETVPSGAIDCNFYTVKQIPTIRNYNAPCPFQDNICRSNSSNLMLDTGLVNIHDHLGVNLPAGERILWRKVLSCAPLVTSGRTSNHSTADGNYTRYHYGDVVRTRNSTGTVRYNFTYSIDSVESQYAPFNFTNISYDGNTYILAAKAEMTANETTASSDPYTPIPELRRDDGDLTLLFLSGNSIAFMEPLDDDWYRATVPYSNISSTVTNEVKDLYRMADAASPMGCVEQYQLCAETPNICGPLAGFLDAYVGAVKQVNMTMTPDNAGTVNASVQRLIRFGTMQTDPAANTVSMITSVLGSRALVSQQTLLSNLQPTLPKDQWKNDMTQMWNIGLAALQGMFVETVSEGVDKKNAKALAPGSDDEYNLCQNVKIRSSRHSSFSLFWLIFTYAIGIFVITISYILEPCLACLHRRHGYRGYHRLEWLTNETLQLQRLANEDPGSEFWLRSDEDIPMTRQGVQLGGYDLRDPEHPRVFPPYLASPVNEEVILLQGTKYTSNEG
ncbi:uncharacterized protein F4822DRAFT_270921 [Hypoxylon trugodes]|uniref:uncharacterized protein n=1 Tax=Hypoxylon trugodes TaxID=326681 RepID=UPI0021949217|nr:uncharacterized protein F4822DRAFT_270921 [Hypoxylon trugodes]KAI1389152.1 hypothetical protein F4822DRAFT_270921 [Hypoxylon trugodes]